MNRPRTLRILAALLCLLLCLPLLAGCQTAPPDDQPPLTGPATYTVTLTDYAGNAPTDAILIEVLRGDTQVTMKKMGKDGVTTFELERGDYTFIPKSSGGEIYYDTAACTLTAEVTEARVVLYGVAESTETIYPHVDEAYFSYDAALVGEGATYVSIDRTDRAFYLFEPTRGGMYRIRCISDTALELGYFGDSHVVLDHNVGEIAEDGSITVEVYNSSIGTSGGGSFKMVFGISGATATDTILVIERIGDPTPILPWTMIEATERPDSFTPTDYLNHRLVDISVTDPSVKVVFNNADGYYHYGSETGPVVYLRLDSASPYLQSIMELCETANLCCFFYDEEGNVIRKEGYNQLFASYAEICDANGVVPLTEELADAIKNNGDHMGWWDFATGGNEIFGYDPDGTATGVTEDDLVKENAWLFACCYVETFVRGGEDSTIRLAPSDTRTYRAILPESGALYFTASGGATLTVKNAEGLSVTCGGSTYLPDDKGTILVALTDGAADFSVTGPGDTAFEFTLVLAAD